MSAGLTRLNAFRKLIRDWFWQELNDTELWWLEQQIRCLESCRRHIPGPRGSPRARLSILEIYIVQTDIGLGIYLTNFKSTRVCGVEIFSPFSANVQVWYWSLKIEKPYCYTLNLLAHSKYVGFWTVGSVLNQLFSRDVWKICILDVF